MKYYLLIAGQGYYPQAGTEDWIDTFETSTEAKAEVTSTQVGVGRYKNPIFDHTIRGRTYDWYEIIDLEEWINK